MKKMLEKRTRDPKKQREVAYILYMMISSYFAKTRCTTPVMEKNLFLYYKEMQQNKQIQIEEQVLRTFERKYEWFLDIMKDLRCEASIRWHRHEICISFQTGIWNIRVAVDEYGRFYI